MARLLDLFAGAGGAGAGYQRAGYKVTAVDQGDFGAVNPADEYLRADALDVLDDIPYCRQFDVIHASPPCQAYSATRHLWKRDHPELIPSVRARLREIGVPYVLENVV